MGYKKKKKIIKTRERLYIYIYIYIGSINLLDFHVIANTEIAEKQPKRRVATNKIPVKMNSCNLDTGLFVRSV